MDTIPFRINQRLNETPLAAMIAKGVNTSKLTDDSFLKPVDTKQPEHKRHSSVGELNSEQTLNVLKMIDQMGASKSTFGVTSDRFRSNRLSSRGIPGFVVLKVKDFQDAVKDLNSNTAV